MMSTNRVKKLYTATMKGDWDIAQTFTDILEEKITERDETALHVAAIAEKPEFVEKLLAHLQEYRRQPFLEKLNTNGNTALCYAATTGDVRIADAMLKAYDGDSLANFGRVKPITIAASLVRREMVRHLYGKTNIDGWTNEEAQNKDRIDLFTDCLRHGLFDVARDMIDKYEEVAAESNSSGKTALDVLACEPSVFVPQTRPRWIVRVARFCTMRNNEVEAVPTAVDMVIKLYRLTMNIPDSENFNKKVEIARPLLRAAKNGNDAFIIELVGCDPDLLWIFDTNLGTMFHVAVRNRRENVFSLLYDKHLGSIKDLVADREVSDGKNILQFAAELAPPDRLNLVSGAALQMQRELLWFKAVEKIVPRSYKDRQDSNNQIPQIVFNDTHKALASADEKWMKETSKSSMVVAALISTVMFAAAFTVPGGYDNSDGSPIFEKRKYFLVFALAEANALLCSSTAILMFHSIITSRYADNDFIDSLPSRMVVGVTLLFVSVAAMMLAFCATFLLYFRSATVPIIGLLALVACVPILCVWLKYPLLVDLIRTTHTSRLMFKPQKRLFSKYYD